MSDCGCPQCESRVEYGLPVLEIRSATEESRLAYDLAIAVFEDFHFLQKIWRTFEDTLTSRWTELSVSERQELLKVREQHPKFSPLDPFSQWLQHLSFC